MVAVYRSSDGALMGTYEYDLWGKPVKTTRTDEDKYNITERNPIRYRSYYYDTETGLYYLNARYYDPSVRRFLNADSPAFMGGGDAVSYNLYAYCKNDPVNRIDSNGNWSTLATVGVCVGAALCIAAVTVLTCGVGTATLAGAIAAGAAKGALLGAFVGAGGGAAVGYALTGTASGAAEGAAIGFGVGAVAGAVVGGATGANSWYSARALEFTNNPGSSEVVLGRSGTYEKVATQRGSTYFHTSEARWNEVEQMIGIGKKGMWKINKTFLDQQIAAGKTFLLANDPLTDGGFYFAKEVAYLAMKGVGNVLLK